MKKQPAGQEDAAPAFVVYRIDCEDEFADHPRLAALRVQPQLRAQVLSALAFAELHGVSDLHIPVSAGDVRWLAAAAFDENGNLRPLAGFMNDGSVPVMMVGVHEVDDGAALHVMFEGEVSGPRLGMHNNGQGWCVGFNADVDDLVVDSARHHLSCYAGNVFGSEAEIASTKAAIEAAARFAQRGRGEVVEVFRNLYPYVLKYDQSGERWPRLAIEHAMKTLGESLDALHSDAPTLSQRDRGG